MSKQMRLVLVIAVAMSTGLLAGCNILGPHQRAPAVSSAASLPDGPVLGFEPVAKGVYISVDRRTPLTGEALTRAKMPRDRILAKLTAQYVSEEGPATQPATQPSPGDRGAEPPPLAIKYYLQGRERFLEGANTDSMDFLEKALSLDPQAFTVLRLMGRVSFASSQLARGAMFLERAHKLRPQDVEVNYLLGRYSLERSDYDKAVYYLMQAEDSPEKQITSTQTPLTAFFLGIALQQAGYHAAAAKEYEHFIELAALPVPGYRYDAELTYLIQMQWAADLAAAENDARIGAYHAAVPHYKAAATAQPQDAFIGSRYINALVHDDQPDAARKAALSLLTATHATEDAVDFLGWTYRVTGREGSLIGDLTAYLQTHEPKGDENAALTLSSTLEFLGRKAEAFATLKKFADSHPTNLEALGRLLKQVDNNDEFVAAMTSAGRAIEADRSHTPDVVKLFVPVAQGPAGEAHASAGKYNLYPVAAPGQQQSGLFAAVDYLEALSRQAQNLPAESVDEAYDAALKWGPDFRDTRNSYVRYLLGQEKFARANSLIDAALKGNARDAASLELQIDAEIAQQRFAHALQLSKDAAAKFPENADLRMQLVSVYRLRGQDKDADNELQSFLKINSKYEPAYESLVNSLFQRAQAGGDPDANLGAIVTVLNKLATELPDSRYGRITGAIVYARGGRLEEADAILRQLLITSPDDPEVLIPAAQVRQLVNRPAEAVSLLESALKHKAQPDLVKALAGIYRDQNRPADALALTRRYVAENPTQEVYVLLEANELAAQHMIPDAIELLKDGCRRFPKSQTLAAALARFDELNNDHDGAVHALESFVKSTGDTTDRLYLLSHYYSENGNEDASVAALQRVLAIMPDHIGANNDLGYFWTDAGIHLDQAEPMIKKALENKPDDPAFLDSLGWLYYKQGRFSQAAPLFQRAIDLPGGLEPEVVQHLGDTLYRLGKNQDAVEYWKRARQLLSTSDTLSSTDKRLQEYLNRAITDAEANRQPTLSPTAEVVKAKAAGRAGPPASTPQ